MSSGEDNRKIARHRKVRSGCESCKKRKIKCNERHPVCGNCLAHSYTCVYRQPQSPYPVFDTPSTDEQGIVRFSTRDLRLVHHWTTSTADTVGATKELRDMMRESSFSEALTKPYFMHILLAVSSLHIAHLDPTSRSIYQPLAKYHYSIALPLFRANIPFVSRTNCHALYACSQMLVVYLFASSPSPSALFFSSPHDADHDSMMAEVIALTKGAYLIRDTYSEWLKQGPMGPTATNLLLRETPSPPTTTTHNISTTVNSKSDAALAQLSTQLPTLNSHPADLAAASLALHTLRQLFLLNATSTSQTETKGLCKAWLAEAPPAFFQNVRDRKPEALVVLAHFCIALEEINSDEVWYMKGWSRSIFGECWKGLEGNDRAIECIAWPLAVFGGEGGLEGRRDA